MQSRVEVRDGNGKLAEVEIVADLWEARRIGSRVLGATRIEVFRPRGRRPYAVLIREGTRGRWLRAYRAEA